VLKIQTNRWLALNKFRPKRQKVLQFQVFGLKKSRPKAFHSPCDNLHAVVPYGSKSYGNLVLNKSKPKYTNKGKQYRAKNPNKSLAWFEQITAKTAEGALILSIWLVTNMPCTELCKTLVIFLTKKA
jgi:hypothetical protein